MSAPTATCPECKRPGRRLTKAGVIRKHQRWSKNFSGRMEPDCPGSGKPPRTPKGENSGSVAPEANQPA